MHENVIVCLCIGSAYSDAYVQKLQRMVARNLTVLYDFVCYSDRIIEGVDTILIDDPDRYDPVWYKLQLLSLPNLAKYKHKAFFDLDVVIHGNINWIFSIADPGLHVIESRWKTHRETMGKRNTGCNSSVMLWQNASHIYNHFLTAPDKYMMMYIGIDRFLWNENADLTFIPRGHVYSYREGESIKDRLPCIMRPDMSVCIYNGMPKPETCTDKEPAKTHWN